MDRCKGHIEYETISGSRVYREEDGRKIYNWRCDRCGATGEGNGKRGTCNRANPEVVYTKKEKWQEVRRGEKLIGYVMRISGAGRNYWQWSHRPKLDQFIGKFVTRGEAVREMESRH